MNITTKPYAQAANVITAALREKLHLGPVLLLLSGGSAAEVYHQLSSSLELDLTPGQLVVSLGDERYDLDPDHPNANGKLINSTGLITRLEQLGGIYSPVLHGLPMAEEVAQFQFQLTQYVQHEQRQIIAVLGFGPDGHTAGILPDPDAERFKARFDGNALAVGYDNDGPFPQRITVTFPLLRLSSTAIVLAKDASKLPIIQRATNRNYPEPLNLLPASIIQEIDQVIITAPNEEKL